MAASTVSGPPFDQERGFYRVNQGRLLVSNQIRVVGDASNRLIAVRVPQGPIHRPHPVDVVSQHNLHQSNSGRAFVSFPVASTSTCFGAPCLETPRPRRQIRRRLARGCPGRLMSKSGIILGSTRRAHPATHVLWPAGGHPCHGTKRLPPVPDARKVPEPSYGVFATRAGYPSEEIISARVSAFNGRPVTTTRPFGTSTSAEETPGRSASTLRTAVAQ